MYVIRLIHGIVEIVYGIIHTRYWHIDLTRHINNTHILSRSCAHSDIKTESSN